MRNPDQMVLTARLRALKVQQEFYRKWGEFPAALPTGGAAPTPEGGEFNQFENPAQGGLSPEGRIRGSDRVSATGIDAQGNDA